MNRNFCCILSFLIVSLFAISCTKDTSNPQFLSLPGKIVYKTPCKSLLKSSTQTNIKSNQSCVEYDYNEISKTLTLKHINAGFNCSPDSIWCITSSNNNILLIEEKEKWHGVRCLCLYDITIMIGSVEKQNYFVRFDEPYSETQAKLEFDIDLISSPSGSFCVNRYSGAWY